MTSLLTTSAFDAAPLALGMLKLATTSNVSDEEAEALIHFALANGIRVFDTADCYFRSDDDPRFGEHILRNALKSWPGDVSEVVVMTKAGLTRSEGTWVPNGRPDHIRETALASLQALGVEQLPVLQLHVRDPDVPFRETLGALKELQDEGIVRQLGLCNTTPAAIAQAESFFEVASIQNEVSPWRFGQPQKDVVAAAADRNIPLFAFRPLNDGKQSRRSAATKRMDGLAESHEITRSEAAIAWLRSLGNHVIPLFGATRMASIKSSCAAVRVDLGSSDDKSAAAVIQVAESRAPAPQNGPDVLIVMGIQGSGKSEFVTPFVEAGYQRLNRDLLGGTLKDLVPRLDRLLAGGRNRVVLDNTYSTRASREAVIASAKKYRAPVRCLHIRTPLIEAQKNVVLRMIAKYGMPLGPVEMEMMRKADPNLPPPQALARWLQTYEAPVASEGFDEIVELPFERRFNDKHTNKGLLLDVDGTIRKTLSGNVFPRHPDDVELLPNRRDVLQTYLDDDYRLFFVSNQGGIAAGMVTHEAVQAAMYRTVELLDLPITEITYCSHPTRPVGCFCRKPLPGLGVYLMERHQLDPEECIMVGDMDSDREFAAGLGVRFHWANDFFQ